MFPVTSLSLIGVGRIGGGIAFLTSYLGLIDELVLYDIQPGLLEAQMKDLKHAIVDIEISTDAGAVRETDICVMTAGVPRNPSVKARADLIEANAAVAAQCSTHLRNFGGILIVVSNPVDVLTPYLAKLCDLNPERCIGFGGQLDSARFGLELEARGAKGDPWVLGEHGEHQVPLFSRLMTPVDIVVREEILNRIRGSSMEIIKGKGGTIFGPVAHIVTMLEMVIDDAGTLIPCSCILQGEYGVEGCALGVPARLGREGIDSIEQWSLDTWEQDHFNEAAAFIRGLCGTLIGR